MGEQSNEKEYDFEAGRIFGPDGKLLSIVLGKTVYREIAEAPAEPTTGRYL